MNHKTVRALILAGLVAACASPESRIKRNRAIFDAYPPEVQEKIRKGSVDVGFTEDQVRMALGKPDRVYSRKTETSTQQVWAYAGGGRGGTSLGLGFGMGGGSVGYGLGLGVGSDAYGSIDDKVRVVFEGGRVVDVQTRVKS